VFKLSDNESSVKAIVRSSVPKSTSFKGGERRSNENVAANLKAAPTKQPTPKPVQLPNPATKANSLAGGEDDWEKF
jgi:hypothetical protein